MIFQRVSNTKLVWVKTSRAMLLLLLCSVLSGMCCPIAAIAAGDSLRALDAQLDLNLEESLRKSIIGYKSLVPAYRSETIIYGRLAELYLALAEDYAVRQEMQLAYAENAIRFAKKAIRVAPGDVVGYYYFARATQVWGSINGELHSLHLVPSIEAALRKCKTYSQKSQSSQWFRDACDTERARLLAAVPGFPVSIGNRDEARAILASLVEAGTSVLAAFVLHIQLAIADKNIVLVREASQRFSHHLSAFNVHNNPDDSVFLEKLLVRDIERAKEKVAEFEAWVGFYQPVSQP